MRIVPVKHVVALAGIAIGVFACAVIVFAAGRALEVFFK